MRRWINPRHENSPVTIRLDVKGGIDWIGVTLLGAALILLNLGLGSPEISADDAAVGSPQHTLYWVAGAAATMIRWQNAGSVSAWRSE